MSSQSLPPPPRKVKLISLWKDPMHLGFVLAGAIFILIFVVQGTVFTWFSMPWIDATLDREGRWTTGTLLGTEVVAHEHQGSRHPIMFRYRFQIVENGQARAIEGHSKTYDASRVPVGSNGEVRVSYLPGRPGWNRAEGTRFSLFPVWLLVIPIIMLVVGSMFLRVGLGRRAYIRKILEHGEEATGVILGTRKLWYMTNKRTGKKVLRVSFEHTHPYGQRCAGHTDTFRDETMERLTPGSSVRLLVMPEQPKQAVILELVETGEIIV